MRRPQTAGVEDLAQHVVRAGLVERQRAVVDQGDRRRVHVEQRDVEPAVGQRQPEREPDVPATPDDRDVDRERRCRHRGGAGTCRGCGMVERVRAPTAFRPGYGAVP